MITNFIFIFIYY